MHQHVIFILLTISVMVMVQLWWAAYRSGKANSTRGSVKPLERFIQSRLYSPLNSYLHSPHYEINTNKNGAFASVYISVELHFDPVHMCSVHLKIYSSYLV